MRYAIIAVIIVAIGLIIGVVGAATYDQIDADDPQPEVLSGTELTIEDWIACRDQINADNEASGSGAPKLTALPSLIDGEWRFAGVLGGEFYSCQGTGLAENGGRVIPTP